MYLKLPEGGSGGRRARRSHLGDDRREVCVNSDAMMGQTS